MVSLTFDPQLPQNAGRAAAGGCAATGAAAGYATWLGCAYGCTGCKWDDARSIVNAKQMWVRDCQDPTDL